MPRLVANLTPFLPTVLRPFESALADYAAQALDQVIAAEYARIAARTNTPERSAA